MTKFNELNISPEIIRAVEEMGYEEATPIQASAIPAIMEGHDVLGLSNTGTGKTAAFGIPAIELINEYRKNPKVLMICPTRELVEQVATELRKFSKYKEGTGFHVYWFKILCSHYIFNIVIERSTVHPHIIL